MTTELLGQFFSISGYIIYFVLLLAFIILSMVLNYHWTNYGIEQKKIADVRLWYFSISGFLIVIMTITIFYITIW